jgi:hypothetical protein
LIQILKDQLWLGLQVLLHYEVKGAEERLTKVKKKLLLKKNLASKDILKFWPRFALSSNSATGHTKVSRLG